MTRKAGYPLGRAPEARGGAGGDVVEVRSALPPTAVHAPSLVRSRADRALPLWLFVLRKIQRCRGAGARL